ncbi:apolipoprotein N-acyltransferase [candidate division KSB1 bacterium]|nr:apolipoprotein N-acyltransferase [candidate division KSB1 bacterium]
MKKWLLLSVLSSTALAAAFPPSRLGFMAYWALVPFFVLLDSGSYKHAIKWGYITGLFLNMWTLYWINWVTLPGMIGAILYLPVFYVIYAVFHTFLRKRLGKPWLFVCIPFLWTGVEYLRTLGVLGFPWTSLAYTQTYYLSLIQYAPVTSLYGVSFWIVTLNVIIWALFAYAGQYRRVVWLYTLLLILLLFPWIYGKFVIPKDSDQVEKVRVAVVQGNIDPFAKSDSDFWDTNFEIYDRLSREAMKLRPEMMIWPETAVPCYLRYTPTYKDKVTNLVDNIGIPLITGAHDAVFKKSGGYNTYNAVFLIRPHNSAMPIYAKLHLVPFGERVPFTEVFPQLKAFLESFELGEGNFSPGNKLVTFKFQAGSDDTQKKRVKIPIGVCFESLFPDLIRKFIVNENANLLGIITNDGWFRRSQAPYHHAQAAVFRAIENRISIARSANTGISLFVDPYGHILQSSPTFEEAYLVADLPLRTETTFFTAHGNVFSVFCTIFNLGPIFVAMFQDNKEDSSDKTVVSIHT